MWTAAAAVAMASPGIAEARVEAGEAVVGCLVGSPAEKERSAETKSVEESEIFQEEIRTLMRSQTTESLELEDSGSRSSCFTAHLGLVSLHGITRPRGDRAPISTATPSMLTPLLYSTPDPVFLRPDHDVVVVAAEAAVVEEKPGHGSLAYAAGSNAVVQPAGSEQAAVCEQSQKRCAKRKEPEKKNKSKGKSASPGSAVKKGKAGAVGRCQASDDKETAAAAAAPAAAVGDDDVKSCEFEEVDANKEKVKLPYVHVRARRGQATDRHSLAERARREKINARMKLLQDLVPGCNKVSGTALVLEEIINHVQTLQRQVEILSMRLAAVNPSFDLSALDGFLDAADALAMMDLPNVTWGFQVPDTLSQQEGWLWQHLLQPQHQVDGDAMIAPQHPQHHQQQLLQVASTSEWARPGDVHHHHHLHRHGSLRYESSNPVPLPPNRVKAEL